jgi:hypothetical protein
VLAWLVASGLLSVSRLLAIVTLAALWPARSALSRLPLAAAATLVVAAVAVSDTWMARARARSPAGETPSVG